MRACRTPTGPKLDDAVTIVIRPPGILQLGWDPESAVLLTPPETVTATALASALRRVDGTKGLPQLLCEATASGVPVDVFTAVLAELTQVGIVTEPDCSTPPARVAILGHGPIADRLLAELPRTIATVYLATANLSTCNADLVVLTDQPVVAPEIVEQLMQIGLPHLVVRVRDSIAVVGPLVYPKSTSCLRCADLTRAHYDSAWPFIAAQLVGRSPRASPSAVCAAVAFAMDAIEQQLTQPDLRPATINGTVEIDVRSQRVGRRIWPPHPSCGCITMRSPHDER